MKKIILTGGGTAGHVTPNLALVPELKKKGYEIEYIGSIDGMEKNIIENEGIKYYGISSGKLRRYLSKKNISDLFKVIKGIKQASKILKDIKPSIVFSKGGFVSVPVVIAAWRKKIPVVIHESDISPGLANKIAIPFANAVCTAFPEAINKIPSKKAVLTGTPIRQELFNGSYEKGKQILNFKSDMPVLLVIGGSQGSVKINSAVRNALLQLKKSFNIIHICGKGNIDKNINIQEYKQFEYVSSELCHLFAYSDIIVSRSGANSIYEFLALKKPNLLIPLPKAQSRGDQILNANSFEKQGFSKVLYEENLNEKTLTENLLSLYKEKEKYISKMNNANLTNGVKEVIKIIDKFSNI